MSKRKPSPPHGGVSGRIRADAEEACGRFPSVQNLLVDGEIVTFQVDGEEFTVALPEVYGSSCNVYGPDEFDLSCQGSIVDIVAAVLRELEGGSEDRDCPNGDSCSSPPMLLRDISNETDPPLGSDGGELAAESPEVFARSFPQLQQEILELEAMGASCSVDGVLGDAAILTLGFPLPDTISRSTAEAWGFARDKPLKMTFNFGEAHYARTSAHRLEVNFWQDKSTAGYTPLDAGVQLVNIARAFWRHMCGTATSAAVDGTASCLEAGPALLVAKRASLFEEVATQPGVLVPFVWYLRQRLPCLHEFCVICDEPLVFPPLLRPTVCTRTLCCYSARTFGAAVTGEFSSQNASLEVWDLLVAMAICAGRMDKDRMQILFANQNFPQLFLPGSTEPAITASTHGLDRLRELLQLLATYRAGQVGPNGINWLNKAFSERGGIGAVDELLPQLLSWVWDSNRSFILALEKDDRMRALNTPFQYLLLSAPPEMEAAFQALKKKHGSMFCFHGSISANWHCILRQGLKNASGTRLMTAGQAHGAGIYLARDSGTSASYSLGHGLGYAQRSGAGIGATAGAGLKEGTGRRLHDPESLVMLAVCEVAQVPSLKNSHSIVVCPEEAAVVTRFLLVYSNKAVPHVNIQSDRQLSAELSALTERWTQP